jgi:protein-S-isoprenylcysteine O-methyltransferase Ste14
MAMLKQSLVYLVMLGAIATIINLSAGRWTMPVIWIYAAVMAAILLADNTTLAKESAADRTLTMEGLDGADTALVGVFFLTFISHWIVAGLDVGRWHGTATVPLPLQLAGFVGLAIAFVLARWAISTNRFYSGVVRLTSDHTVIRDGPYQYIRHPAYLSLVIVYLCSGLVIGSWWSFVPMAIAVLMTLRRVRLEDRFLQENLTGYMDYALQVQNRLVPGIW